MGTRSDFYVGQGSDAEWLGSIAWDGYPDGIPDRILKAVEEQDYREQVKAFLTSRDDASLPQHGWPWPWNDSGLTDYAYAFNDNAVWYSVGYPVARWWRALDGPEPDSDDADLMDGLAITEFPNMAHLKSVTLGCRSGLIVV